MSSKNNTLDYFKNLRSRIFSNKGGWVIGKAVYNHGYSMLDELVGEKSYFQLYVLNITGRLPEPSLAIWLEAFYGTISWPDPRIWCNQIGALAGSSQTDPVSAVIAGVLASDSKLYGAGVFIPLAKFIQQARHEEEEGMTVKQIVAKELERKSQHSKTKPVIIGYSRPIATGDERVPVLRKIARELGFDKGPHEKLAEQIEQFVYETDKEGINVGGYAAAFLSDHGYSPEEIYRLTSLLVNSGVQACYAEYFDKPAQNFLPMTCQDIEYIGPPLRKL